MNVSIFILGVLLLLAVAVFALQNPDPVTVRFLSSEIRASVAILTLAATATGAVIAGLLGLASRLLRWQRGRSAGTADAPSADERWPR